MWESVNHGEKIESGKFWTSNFDWDGNLDKGKISEPKCNVLQGARAARIQHYKMVREQKRALTRSTSLSRVVADEVEVVIDIRDIELTTATSGSVGGMNENGFVIYIPNSYNLFSIEEVKFVKLL
ncbi:hypothetical protein Scep_019510 [Stephania cephalantha]|uniref:Uncharacterized protein n=1 Tax=Stephania cephalantha TaxID=152367 RepID=A0AAP0IBX1_9MAGN